MASKSTKLAYAFWCLGGLFGLHHVYLGRDKQALVWLGTLGGFLVGLVRDLFKMPEYVREADQHEQALGKLKKERTKLLAPSPFSLRFLSAVAFSALYGYFMVNCLPEEVEATLAMQLASLIKLTYPLVVAIFVQTAATEVPYKCQFKWPLLGAYLGFLTNMLRGSDSPLTCSVISALFLKWKVKWNERYASGQKSKKGWTKRLVRHSLMTGLIVGLFVLFMWNHASLDMDGKKVSLKESVKGFMNSQEFSKVAEAFTIVWNYYRAHGFVKLKNHLLYGYDPEVIANAYKTIEMSERATQKDLDDRCRLLSRRWHPDKFVKDPAKKAEAEVMFMKIQESCNLLSEHRKSKSKTNQKETDEGSDL